MQKILSLFKIESFNYIIKAYFRYKRNLNIAKIIYTNEIKITLYWHKIKSTEKTSL